jgi:hypothetical protein
MAARPTPRDTKSREHRGEGNGTHEDEIKPEKSAGKIAVGSVNAYGHGAALTRRLARRPAEFAS